MTSQTTDRLSGPTIFSLESDAQVLTWLRHAQSMTEVEGRWKAVWHLFAQEAQQECALRRLEHKAA